MSTIRIRFKQFAVTQQRKPRVVESLWIHLVDVARTLPDCIMLQLSR